MLIRALIVLLLTLNLGVALWWATRTPPPSIPVFEPDPQAERLQLVEETVATVPSTPAPDEPRQCLSLGPFADPEALAAARERLGARVLEARTRREFTGTPDGWRVILPPLADLEQAAAAAERIAAAGFQDYYVMRSGADAGAVALGLYGNEAAARSRAEALREAGFDVRVEPTGAGPLRHWLDLAVAGDVDAAAVQAEAGSPQRQPLDCDTLRQPVP